MTKTGVRIWFCRTISAAIALQTARGESLAGASKGQSAPALHGPTSRRQTQSAAAAEVRVVVSVGSQDLVSPVSRMTIQEEKVEVIRHHRGAGSGSEP